MTFLKSIANTCIIGHLLLSFSSCNKTTGVAEDKGTPVAKVNSSVLYATDLKQISQNGLSKSDSLAFVQTFVNNWAYSEIFYQQAVNYLTEEELNIDKELEDYKKELLTYKFQTKLINEKLDTNEENKNKYSNLFNKIFIPDDGKNEETNLNLLIKYKIIFYFILL